MAKHKKKKHSKNNDVSDDILDATAASIRKFRKITNEIAKLSTGQKLLGGVSLLAAGYLYLKNVAGPATDDKLAQVLPFPLPRLAGAKAPAPAEEPAPAPAPPTLPHKSRKSAKAGKGHAVRNPAASPDPDER